MKTIELSNSQQDRLKGIWDDHVDSIFSFVASLGFETPDTMGLVQEVFFRVGTAIDSIVQGKELAFCRGVARRVAWEEWRKGSKQWTRFPFLEELGPGVAFEEAECDSQLVARLLVVRAMTEALTEVQRNVLGLAFVWGFTESQIAQLLDISVASVRGHKVRALKKAKQYIIARDQYRGRRNGN